MCLGIPARIVELVDPINQIAKAEVAGVRRDVNVGLLALDADPVAVGDWVLIHVGFAMAKIDEDQATATLELLGEALDAEIEELRGSRLR